MVVHLSQHPDTRAPYPATSASDRFGDVSESGAPLRVTLVVISTGASRACMVKHPFSALRIIAATRASEVTTQLVAATNRLGAFTQNMARATWALFLGSAVLAIATIGQLLIRR